MATKRPEVKQGTSKGQRVYWVEFPCCGQRASRDHASKAGANVDKKNHKCDG